MSRLAIFFLMLSACGYHFDGGEKIAVSVPYVVGDYEGKLTNALIYEISKTPQYRYVQHGGDWTLKVKVVNSSSDRIGFRYDRNPKDETLRKNIVGVENRKDIVVEVSILDSCSGRTILCPQTVKANVDFDYVDESSKKDLSFTNPETDRLNTSIAFSLGQLDSIEGAADVAFEPLYRQLARKIVEGIRVFNYDEEPCIEEAECQIEEEEETPPLEEFEEHDGE